MLNYKGPHPHSPQETSENSYRLTKVTVQEFWKPVRFKTTKQLRESHIQTCRKLCRVLLHLLYPFLIVNSVARRKQPGFLFPPLGQKKQGETCLQHSGLSIGSSMDCFCSHMILKLDREQQHSLDLRLEATQGSDRSCSP